MYTPCGGTDFNSPLGQQITNTVPFGHNKKAPLPPGTHLILAFYPIIYPLGHNY